MAIVNSAFASEAAVVYINEMQIGDDQTVCSGKEPETLKGETVAYGDETYTYKWQQSADNFSWTAILGATEASYTPPAKQDADTTYYRRLASVDVSCSPTYSNEVKITTVSTPTYSDIRLSVCPDAGNINLAKYIDTADVITSIEWKHPFISIPDNAGSISTSALATSRIHTLTYTVSSRCVGAQKRKVYLEVLRNGVTRQPRDTIAICHLYAEAVNINQLFGLEAGGTWLYSAVGGENITAYVTESPSSSDYAGAVVMNGKAIYGDSSIPFIANYHATGNNVKMVKFTYTAGTGCLAGKSYSMVIVLTEDIMK
jgi:hypothetical protein